jgi:hypothetical protein
VFILGPASLFHSCASRHCIAVLLLSFYSCVSSYDHCSCRVYVTPIEGRVLRPLYSQTCPESRAAVGAWLKLMATSDRGTRHLTVNALYST